jgi:kynurenine formamidase
MITTQDLEIGTNTMNCNNVKDLVLQKIYEDGILTEEELEKYSTEYQIIIVKRGWFKRWFNKFSPNEDKEAYMMKIVKF